MDGKSREGEASGPCFCLFLVFVVLVNAFQCYFHLLTVKNIIIHVSGSNGRVTCRRGPKSRESFTDRTGNVTVELLFVPNGYNKSSVTKINTVFTYGIMFIQWGCN